MSFGRFHQPRNILGRFGDLLGTGLKIDTRAPAVLRVNGVRRTNTGVGEGTEDFGGLHLHYGEAPNPPQSSGFFLPGGWGYLDHGGTWFVKMPVDLRSNLAAGATPFSDSDSVSFSIFEGVDPLLYNALITSNRPSVCRSEVTSLFSGDTKVLATGDACHSYESNGSVVSVGNYCHIVGATVQNTSPLFRVTIWQGDGTAPVPGVSLGLLGTPGDNFTFGPGMFSGLFPLYAQSDGDITVNTLWYVQ